jgi:tetratricopeptide (TPR) repeat protein
MPKAKTVNSNYKSPLIAIGLIIILGFTVYANSLAGKFIWDDRALITDNVYIKSGANFSKIFTKDIGAGAGKKYNAYRPIQILSYLIDYSLWKSNVIGYHFVNVLLHISVALIIFWLINILYKDNLLACLTSLIFVVHPLHTEAVAYISGRADSLVTIFMLLCFIFYIKQLSLRGTTPYVLMLLTYALALLSRENALILPLLLLLYHYAFKQKIKLKLFLPLLIITFIYVIVRLTLLRPILFNISYSSTFLQRLPGFFVALGKYMRLLFLPFNLHMEYGDTLFKFTHIKTIAGLILLFSLLIYALKVKRHTPLIPFSILWFFITLLPQSNLYPINAYMAEHWLYLPSIGFSLLLAKGLTYLYRYKAKEFRLPITVIIISLLTFYSYLTIKQTNYWKDPISFYKKTLQYTPSSWRLYNNLCNVYNSLGKYKKAITYCIKAKEIHPDYAEIYDNLGTAYYFINKRKKAIEAYLKAIKLNPEYAASYNNLGNVYITMGKYKEAIEVYSKAIEINPTYAMTYNNLGNAYDFVGKKKEAIASYLKAIEINPSYTEAYNNLGISYLKEGNYEQAATLFKKAIEMDKNYPNSYNNLGRLYSDTGKYKEAIILLKKAIEIDQNFAVAHSNLAIAYYHNKQYSLAIKHCNRALALGYNVPPEFIKLLEPYLKEKEKLKYQ